MRVEKYKRMRKVDRNISVIMLVLDKCESKMRLMLDAQSIMSIKIH